MSPRRQPGPGTGVVAPGPAAAAAGHAAGDLEQLICPTVTEPASVPLEPLSSLRQAAAQFKPPQLGGQDRRARAAGPARRNLAARTWRRRNLAARTAGRNLAAAQLGGQDRRARAAGPARARAQPERPRQLSPGGPGLGGSGARPSPSLIRLRSGRRGCGVRSSGWTQAECGRNTSDCHDNT
jgi:hypothetical protein